MLFSVCSWMYRVNKRKAYCIVCSIYHFPMGRSTTATSKRGCTTENEKYSQNENKHENTESEERKAEKKERKFHFENLHTHSFAHSYTHWRTDSLLVSLFTRHIVYTDRIYVRKLYCDAIERKRPKTIHTLSQQTAAAATTETVFITDIIDISGAYMAMGMNGFSIKLKALYLLFLSVEFCFFLRWLLFCSLSLSLVQNMFVGKIKWKNSTSKGFYLYFSCLSFCSFGAGKYYTESARLFIFVFVFFLFFIVFELTFCLPALLLNMETK